MSRRWFKCSLTSFCPRASDWTVWDFTQAEGVWGVDGPSLRSLPMQEGRDAGVGDTGAGRAVASCPSLTNGAGLWVPASASDRPVILRSQCLSHSFFSSALPPPGPPMDPLMKGSCGGQVAQPLLWKATSSLSFRIQPLQTWPATGPEAESQVTL